MRMGRCHDVMHAFHAGSGNPHGGDGRDLLHMRRLTGQRHRDLVWPATRLAGRFSFRGRGSHPLWRTVDFHFLELRLQRWWQFAAPRLLVALPLWFDLAEPFSSARWQSSGLYESLNCLGSRVAAGLAY